MDGPTFEVSTIWSERYRDRHFVRHKASQVTVEPRNLKTDVKRSKILADRMIKQIKGSGFHIHYRRIAVTLGFLGGVSVYSTVDVVYT